MPRLKIRHNPSVGIAAVVAFLGTIPLATASWYLAPLLLIPLILAVWGFRSGTNVDSAGLRARALLSTRFIPWDQISSLEPDQRGRLYAVLVTGGSIRLPAAGAADAARIIDASGQQLVQSSAEEG